MPLPNINITPIPDSDPDAVPALWNTRYVEIDENFSFLLTAIQEQEGNATGADEAVKLAWLIQEAHIELEQWVPDWKLHDDLELAVTEAVAGDDSVDVASTSQLVVGREYVIKDGTNSESIVVAEILSGTRFTATENLVHSYTTGANIVGCQWTKTPRLATAENGQSCYFLPVNVGDDDVDKQVIVRREAENDCTIRVYFKDADHLTWTECTAGEEIALRGRTDFIDIPYTVPGSGDLELKFVCEEGETNSEVDIELIAVMRPFNVNIEIHNEDEEAHPDIRLAIIDAVVAHNTDVDSHEGGLTLVTDEIAAHNEDPSAHNLDVLFPAEEELIASQVDRDFSGPSAWENVDLNAYDETDDLSITANAADQYCRLPAANCPTTPGEAYTLSFTVANLVSTFIIKSYDGTQVLGTVSENGTQAIPFSAATGGGLRIVAGESDSSADFDNFSLKEAANWEPVIEFKVSQHDEDVDAHPAIQTKIGTDIGTHDTDAEDNAHPSIRNKIETDIDAHDESSLAHADIRSEIDADVSIHNADAGNNAHPSIRNKIGTDIGAHNISGSAHSDIRSEIDADVSAHNSNSSAHPAVQTKIGTDIATHNASGTAHASIRAEIDSDVSDHNSDSSAHSAIQTKIGTDISAHNSNSSAHSTIRTTIDNVSKAGGWKTIRIVSSGMTAAAGDLLLASTGGGAFTVTMPASPSVGDAIGFIDVDGAFDIENLTINRNGKTIMGLSQNLVCDIKNAAFSLVYTTNGWRIA